MKDTSASHRATRAVIYQSNLEHNLGQIRKALGKGVRLCVAVKANGYGCDAVNTARAAIAAGAEYLAVATVGEGGKLRECGITQPILLMSMCSEGEVEDAVRLGLTPFVFSKEYIEDFAKAVKYYLNASSACKNHWAQSSSDSSPTHNGLTSSSTSPSSGGLPFAVHLAVDTGMGRIGCRASEAALMAKFINGTGSLVLGGMCTHFAVADSVAEVDREYTNKQFALFTQAIDSVHQAGIESGITHCAESVALFDRPEMQLDMVRAGIVTYGYYPGDMTREYFEKKRAASNTQAGGGVDLRPIMQVESEVCAVRHFKAGESVSYGRTWTAKRDTDIAVLPIGYADGLLRRYSPGLCVAINGKSYPVVGRICMDQCMVDIGLGEAIVRGDKAIIFGDKKQGALQDADDIARMAGTISYEVMTSITSRVPRVVVNSRDAP